MKGITPDSVALSFWSPPYFVGKDYEKHETYGSWQAMLQAVIHEHFRVLKPGGFMVINIADIRCFKDESLPRFHAMNVSMQSSKISREMVLEAQALNPSFNRPRLAAHLGTSVQTIDRRLSGNNIRGGKVSAQTRVNLVGSFLERYAMECGLHLYDHRIWVKDPAWASSKWTANSLKSVDEYEDLYVFCKPGPQNINREKLEPYEWKEWGSRAVWFIRSVGSNDDHEAKFPFDLASRVVRLYTDENDTVLDPFTGSGTTALAAIASNRKYIGIEKEEKYVALARDNIEKFLSQAGLGFE
jgi:DNA modification methylase